MTQVKEVQTSAFHKLNEFFESEKFINILNQKGYYDISKDESFRIEKYKTTDGMPITYTTHKGSHFAEYTKQIPLYEIWHEAPYGESKYRTGYTATALADFIILYAGFWNRQEGKLIAKIDFVEEIEKILYGE